MSELVKRFLLAIRKEQSLPSEYFPGGILPAFRSNELIGYKRPDTTLFFSAISCFTLQSLLPFLDAESRDLAETIIAKIKTHYGEFQNKDGLKTYNFWKTKPSQHFSNGYLFGHFEHFRIPDDVDDTSFVYLTSNPTEQELLWLKQKLTQHANGARQWIRNTYPEYRTLRAYSTWFGKNMYVEFDACVLSNILYCIFQFDLPRNQHDKDSLHYIRSVIETDRYRTEPFRCAHQYPHTTLIIYHVARLMAAFDPEELQPIKSKLVEDATALFTKETHPMYRVLLATSLLRLGVVPERIAIEAFEEKDFKGFYFFIAGLLTAYEHPWLYRLAPAKLFHMHWTCRAHCWTLLLEYEVLSQRALSRIQSDQE